MNVSKRMKHGLLKTQIGTPYYMSPEIWSNKPYNESSDMWALGCLIYELCALHPPFLGDSFPQLKRAVLQGRYKSIPRCYSYEMSTVLSKLMRVNSRSRPSAKDLLSSPEVQKYMKPGGYGSVAPESHRPIDLMETIKVPHGPKRRISAALPKPCYPDARPKSPESWPMSARDRKQAIDKKNGVCGLESVAEDDSSASSEPANPRAKVAPSPLPIKAKGGAANVVKDARNQAENPSRQQRGKNHVSAQDNNNNARKALTPISKNAARREAAQAKQVKQHQRPPRPQNSHAAGARPSAAQYKQADRSSFQQKPHRPGREPNSHRQVGRPSGRPSGRPHGGYQRANGYRNAANVYGGGGGGGQPNYRRGQYSYKPSWWG